MITVPKEHQRARAWRELHNLTPDQLAELTGYSRQAIYWFERGYAPPRSIRGKHTEDEPIKPWVWQRYKRACQGVHAELVGQKKWNW